MPSPHQLTARVAPPSVWAFVLCLLAAPVALPAQAPPAAAEEAPEAPAARYQNTIRWSTASESDNFGFDVYRGDSEEGPFLRLTERPIPGAGNTDEPQRYEFVDDTIDPYQEYYYYVESISMSNQRERFTPVSKARAKLTREPAAAPAEEPQDG